MRQFVPVVRDESLEELYAELDFPEPPPHRPHVYLDMVASVDGAATIEGRTRGLGGEADRVAFSRLREWCDVVLVGAETVRVEDYGPARPSPEARRRRQDRGLAPTPRLAVVTASAALNPGSRLFTEAAEDSRTLVFAVASADDDRIAALAEVADVRTIGDDRVDLGAALAHLREEGVRRILCEGGPSLNAELLRRGLVDELFLTVSPQLVGGARHRIVASALDDAPIGVDLLELREHRGELLLRYAVR